MAANSLVTPTWVMKQIGLRLVNNLRFAANVDRSYSDEFKQSGAKVGYTVNARLPQRYQVNKGQALNPQPVVDNIVPITLTDQANVAWSSRWRPSRWKWTTTASGTSSRPSTP